MGRCPTCGQETGGGVKLARAMRAARETGAHLYHGRDGNYYIEYGGGKVERASINAALSDGLIQPRWAHLPEGYWTLTDKGRSA